MGRGRVLATGVLAVLCIGAGAASARAAFDPAYELSNFSKTTERATRLTLLPDYQAQMRLRNLGTGLDSVLTTITDPERFFLGDLCWSHWDACSGDVRLYDWQAGGHGIVRPVRFTARNGSTLSGHVWMTEGGPERRPGVVITNGSVQAPEELYWFAAQTLAKAGYVVMTWDPQGQGQSDTAGEGSDAFDGVPSQTGEPFYDGTEDALDFFFSRPDARYSPRPSCSTGTDHSAKQRRRVARGRNAAYNPFWKSLDAGRVGLAGHSLGAGAVSYIGQIDPRVKAIVAWDNLGAPGPSAPFACKSGSAPRPADAPITKPALGMSADYGLLPEPNTKLPDPLAKSTASRRISAAGVDSGELIVRGGTHYEFSFIPNPAFGATLRGIDMVAWYTRAWMDKYVKGDAGADALLLTDRWRADAREAAVDPGHDGNMFSRYYRSRLDIGLAGGGRYACEDLRPAACALAPDGGPEDYSYLKAATTKDAGLRARSRRRPSRAVRASRGPSR
jgi:dienelactone hydrolase